MSALKFTAPTVAAVLAASLCAQDHDARTDKSKKPLPQFVQLEQIVGSTVENNDAETIGSIANVVCNRANGQVLLAVVSTGGFLGIGDQLTGVPCSALEWQRQKTGALALRLDTDRDRLGMAPKFETAKVDATLTSDSWHAETRACFGDLPRALSANMTAARDASTGPAISPFILGSALLGSKVFSSTFEDGERVALGAISHAVVVRETGEMSCVVVDGRIVPFNALSCDAKGRFTLDKDVKTFELAPKIEKDATRRLLNEEYRKRVADFYGCPVVVS